MARAFVDGLFCYDVTGISGLIAKTASVGSLPGDSTFYRLIVPSWLFWMTSKSSGVEEVGGSFGFWPS